MATEFSIINHKHKSCSTSSCGSGQNPLPEEILAKVHNHPCYSEEAHHHYARMHVAVAPACNIQCNYCNRKFDCANESRPGVTSEKLSPEEAVKKVLLVAKTIPQMSVVGIAGPGDPLANPDKTFRTFELLARYAPDIKLCLSTNGLRLPDYIDEIKKYNVDHVTITINMIDPGIGAKIYPWIYFNKKRYHGVEASQILYQRQMEGLRLLTENGILCKVNSILIPGVNDEHLVEVSKQVKSMGAFLHNIMPLISAPEHGTYFGLNGQRGPTDEELISVQEQCSGDMKMMRHCRQCRADAVGLLGEDRGEEFTKAGFAAVSIEELAYDPAKRFEVHREIEAKIQEAKAQAEEKRKKSEEIKQRQKQKTVGAFHETPSIKTIRVAVTTKGGGLINQHFGHAEEFLIYSVDPMGENIQFLQARNVARYCGGPETCNDDCEVLEKTVKMLSDCQLILCSRIGPEPLRALEKSNIQVMQMYDLIESGIAQGARAYAEVHQYVPSHSKDGSGVLS